MIENSKKNNVMVIHSGNRTLPKTATIGTSADVSVLGRSPSYRESTKKNKERQGPTLGIHFTEMSHLKRCLLRKSWPYFNSNNMQRKSCPIAQGLVDFNIGLVIFVLNLPDEQEKFFKEFKSQENCYQPCSSSG